MMYSLEKSDAAIVAVKPANKGWQRPAEQMEPRAAAKVNSGGRNTYRTQRRVSVSQTADWIRKQRRGTRRGVPCIECRWPSGNTWSFVSSGKPHGRRKRPLDTASQAVKDAPSVPILSRRFLGLCYGVQTRSLASCLRHQPRQEPRALTRMRGSVRGDWRKPVPYRDAFDRTKCVHYKGMNT